MSRIPHLLARITQRSAARAFIPPKPHQYRKAISTSATRSQESQEHNLSSPARPSPTAPPSGGRAPTPQTHPSYFPLSTQRPPEAPSSRNFYRTHGRALFKALTLAFFTYQVLYWAWLSLETEEIKDGMKREIKGLESEVRLLDEGRRHHGMRVGGGIGAKETTGQRILEESKR